MNDIQPLLECSRSMLTQCFEETLGVFVSLANCLLRFVPRLLLIFHLLPRSASLEAERGNKWKIRRSNYEGLCPRR